MQCMNAWGTPFLVVLGFLIFLYVWLSLVSGTFPSHASFFWKGLHTRLWWLKEKIQKNPEDNKSQKKNEKAKHTKKWENPKQLKMVSLMHSCIAFMAYLIKEGLFMNTTSSLAAQYTVYSTLKRRSQPLHGTLSCRVQYSTPCTYLPCSRIDPQKKCFLP